MLDCVGRSDRRAGCPRPGKDPVSRFYSSIAPAGGLRHTLLVCSHVYITEVLIEKHVFLGCAINLI